MSRRTAFLGAALVVALAGCGRNDDDWTPPPSPFMGDYVGSWTEGEATGYAEFTINASGVVAGVVVGSSFEGHHAGKVESGQYTGSYTGLGSEKPLPAWGVLELSGAGIVGTWYRQNDAALQLTLVRR